MEGGQQQSYPFTEASGEEATHPSRDAKNRMKFDQKPTDTAAAGSTTVMFGGQLPAAESVQEGGQERPLEKELPELTDAEQMLEECELAVET